MLFQPLARVGLFPSTPTLRALESQLERLVGESRRAEPPAVLSSSLYARDDALLLRTALPGVDAKDLTLEVDGNVLKLSGRFEEAPIEADTITHRHERPHGEFQRSLRLPFEVEAGAVEARLERGVLEVRIPRAQKTPPAKIPVRSEVERN